ncbi:hypothetical protein [Sedimentitalea nanhaiensis]|uniref:Uncharacterized protein n=1 Tax=Sedimentitalea nanhaiensis TaxID=999627 RepID=A0A1I6Z300_9RHOB|nr:hypothetical protein [Sedimentitalea nanhaiensis]SFT57093.1 hypothetical protein SAMN05216236_103195 [Sedimentitalea nanhaiensis]
MTVLFFFAQLLLVSIFVSVVMAHLSARAPFLNTIGAFSTGLLGLAGGFAIAFVLFLLLNPDPTRDLDAQVPLLLRTLPITGFSVFFWAPAYVVLFNRLRRRKTVA